MPTSPAGMGSTHRWIPAGNNHSADTLGGEPVAYKALSCVVTQQQGSETSRRLRITRSRTFLLPVASQVDSCRCEPGRPKEHYGVYYARHRAWPRDGSKYGVDGGRSVPGRSHESWRQRTLAPAGIGEAPRTAVSLRGQEVQTFLSRSSTGYR